MGFALEVGDRLLINGEEVIFKGWVDQFQTAIEVKAIANDTSPVKQIRAKEIRSLARSPHLASNGQTSAKSEAEYEQSRDSNASPVANAESVAETSPSGSAQAESENQVNSDRVNPDTNQAKMSDNAENTSQIEESPEIPKEPEYNAWEVWTYLERQRVNTLKLINTFHAEWEANRFVREAERSAPPNLRVHYEIRPVLLDESELNGNYQSTEKSYKSQDNHPDDAEEDYADAIDVEVII